MKLGLQLLVIENFQSLRGPVEIPIRPLTLLYGPNSAGKSAVFDALHLLTAFLGGRDAEVSSMLQRWAHRPDPSSRGLPVRLRAEAITFSSLEISDSNVAAGRLPSCLWEDPNSVMSEERTTGPIIFSIDITWHQETTSISIEINRQPSMSIEEKEFGEMNLQIFEFPFGKGLRALADLYDTDPDHEEAFLVRECNLLGQDDRIKLSPIFRDEKWGDYESILVGIGNWFLLRAFEVFKRPPLVDAGRGLISNRELVVMAARSKRHMEAEAISSLPIGFASIDKLHIFPDPRMSTSVVMLLGCSYLDHYWLHKNPPKASEQNRGPNSKLDMQEGVEIIVAATLAAAAGHDHYQSSKENLIQFVNRCLHDHLFIDQGYTVHFDVCEVLPDQNSAAANTTWSDCSRNRTENPREPVGVAALLLCSLRDKAMRSVTFEDVGTGISCVLPVLAALHSGYSFIQQPELHLHPALQSALGDVMAEAANRDRGLHLIETHSEHILLRCLRRLRQTAGGRQQENSPLRLVPDQLSVLYFDPQPDGTTRVKRIRVSEDGEFLDRWPRGFFEERGRDLFDE